MKFKLSKYILSTEELSDYGMENKRIVFSTRSATSMLLQEDIHNSLKNGDFANIDRDVLYQLVESCVIVPEELDEFAFVIEENQKAQADTDTLSMTIQPTANCQLGCHYCAQNHTKDYSSPKVQTKILKRIEHLLTTKKYKNIHVTWYGGEPLMGLSSIKNLSKSILKIAVDNNLSYSADMVTNGLALKNDIFQTLAKESFIRTYQITIDGTAETHDKRRITKTGNGTFDIIIKNIVEVVNNPCYDDLNCKITIRINIDKSNEADVIPLVDYLTELNLQNKISIYFTPIVDWGGNNASSNSLSREDYSVKEIDWQMRLIDKGFGNIPLPERVYQVCMVEDKNAEVYDVFGNIYSCWEFPYTEVYGKGDTVIGNLNFPYETYNENATLRDWKETLVSEKTRCKECTHLPICCGGCPKSWHEGTPACPSFKTNYQDKLLLQYLTNKQNEKSLLVNSK